MAAIGVLREDVGCFLGYCAFFFEIDFPVLDSLFCLSRTPLNRRSWGSRRVTVGADCHFRNKFAVFLSVNSLCYLAYVRISSQMDYCNWLPRPFEERKGGVLIKCFPSQLLSTFLLLAVRLLFELVVQFFRFRVVHIRGILFVKESFTKLSNLFSAENGCRVGSYSLGNAKL